MSLGSVAPPVLCRAPLWATPPSSSWFAPRAIHPRPAMNKIGDFCQQPTSPQSDTDSSHCSTDSREVSMYSQYETSPEDYGRSHTSSAAVDSSVPTSCMWKGCNRSFNQLDNLSAHVASKHANNNGGLFYCEWEGCPRGHKGFNARYKMLVHVRTHTKERPHSCHICGKSFSRAENLKIHSRSHSGEKPYVCSVPGCGKAYSNSSDRFKHTRTHIIEKPYCCKIPGCEKRYTDPSSLRKHVKTFKHTNITTENINNQKELRNGNTENKTSVQDRVKQQEIHNKYDKSMTIPKTTSVSESEVYQQHHKEYPRKYSYSENACYISENVYETNNETTKLNTTNYESDDVEYRNNVINNTTPSYNSSIEDVDDESNSLCFCKDLPCIHTSRYVQPEYLRVEPLSYNTIQEKVTFLKKSFIEEPLNLKRRYFENHYNESLMNLDKKSKTDYHLSIMMDNCLETPLDLSNKTFF